MRTHEEDRSHLSSLILNKVAALRIAAAVIAICLLPSPFIGSVGDESVAHATTSSVSFSRPVAVNDNKANVQAAPVIMSVPGQELFVAWQDSRSGNEDIYVSKSLDNGTTFTVNRRADDSIVSSKQIEPSVAIAECGTICLAWQDNRRRTLDFDIYFSKSTDGGETFARNIKVDDSADPISWQERPSVAVSADNIILVAWTDDRTGYLRIRKAVSTDEGATFGPSEELTPPNGQTSGQTGIALVANGHDFFAAFVDNVSGTPHPYLSVSNDWGETFSTPIRLDTGGNGFAQRSVGIAPLPMGGVVAAWEDSRSGNWDIYSSILSQEGAIVVPDFRVDDDPGSSDQRDPWLTADQRGNVYAIWEDERADRFAVRFAYLVQGQVSFGQSHEIAVPGGDDMQRRPSICSPAPGHVYVTWQDDKAGSYDIYSSTGLVPELDVGIPPPVGRSSLRITTSPAVPTTIMIDGNWASPWGLDWVTLDSGTYTLSFTDVPGYVTPAPVEVTVTAGQTTSYEARFVPCGSLRVMTSPAVPSTIFVNGMPRNDWGLWTDVPAGTYTVSFGAVAGYESPAAQIVTVTSGGYVEVTGAFVPRSGAPGPDPATYGMLRVTTSPSVPSTIQVDGSWMGPWGLDWVKLAPGTHTLSFSDVPGFVTPDEIAFTVSAGTTIAIAADFTPCGSLRVMTSPAVDSTIYVDGIPRNNWGVWADLPPGTYVVSFGEVPARVTAPPRTVTVTAGAYVETTGAFIAVE